MQAEQRERLVALAAQVASEAEPARFHGLVLQLNQLLEEISHIRGDNGKNVPIRPQLNEKL